jgi:uncharacterized membrane protein
MLKEKKNNLNQTPLFFLQFFLQIGLFAFLILWRIAIKITPNTIFFCPHCLFVVSSLQERSIQKKRIKQKI